MDQSSTPWRVFDAPETAGAATTGAPPGTSSIGTAIGASTNPRLAIAAVAGAVVVGVLAIVIAMSGAGTAVVEGPSSSQDGGAGSFVAAGGELVIDVTGAVAKPGIYRLATGARVGNAIDAAGGFSPRVDVDRVGRELNLAAILADGAQVHVPSRDDPAGGGSAGASPGAGGSGGGGGLVNLNSATEAELDALSGIGPVTAGKIIESRATAAFKTVDELRERGLVGQKTFDKIRAQLTVG